MDYDNSDGSQPPQAIAVDLPLGFRAPAAELLERLASRVAAQKRTRLADRFGWMLAFPAGVAAAFLGLGWRLLSVVVALLVAFPVASILVERWRHRRTVSLP